MTHATGLGSMSFLLVLLAVAPATSAQTASPADGSWTGSAQCVLTTSSGYRETQTHTWTLSGEPATISGDIREYPATWTATGSGLRSWGNGVHGTQYTEQWTITVAGIKAPIAIWVRASDGSLMITARHGQLRAPGGIRGSITMPNEITQESQSYTRDMFEYAFPVIQASRPYPTTITGSKNMDVGGTSFNSAVCSWDFRKSGPPAEGSPGPKPPVAPDSSAPSALSGVKLPTAATDLKIANNTAVTSSAPDGPWAGSAQCVLSAKSTGYTETETHTWTLTGAPPTINGAFREYPATWAVSGSGRRVTVAGVHGTTTEQWHTSVAGVNAPISIWVRASDGALMITSRQGQLRAPGATTVVRTFTPSDPLQPDSTSEYTKDAAEWGFPVIQSVVTNTTVAGSSPEGSALACTWQFVKSTPSIGVQMPGTVPLRDAVTPAIR